jgi:hypothetical protein
LLAPDSENIPDLRVDGIFSAASGEPFDFGASLPPPPIEEPLDKAAPLRALIPPRTFDHRVTERLATLTPGDVAALDSFFRGIFKCELAGYTLFFDKPSSWIGVGMIVLKEDGWHYEPTFEETKVRGMEVLNRNFGDLNSNIGLTASISEHFGGHNIFLIDRAACLRQIEKNLDIFQSIFNEQLSAKEILVRIEASNRSPLRALNNSHCGLGILLGFGREDSVHFQEMMELSDRGETEALAALQYIHKFESKQGLFDRCTDPVILELIAGSKLCQILNYATWKSEAEVDALRLKFAMEKAVIDLIAREPDFLERVLERLCQTSPATLVE